MRTPEQIYAEWAAIDKHNKLEKELSKLSYYKDRDHVKGKMRKEVKKLSEVKE